MRRFLIMVSLIALAVNLIQAREKKVLAQEEEEEVVYSGGIKVDLTEEEVQEAINWGAENKDSPEVLIRAYAFGNPRAYEESGHISTKFSLLAFLGCHSARRYKRPERADIEAVLGEKTLGVGIFTYGDKIDFAKDYHMVLKQGEKVIQPVSVKAPGLAEMTAHWPESPSYRATVRAEFSYSEIDLKAKAIVILVKDRGESSFEVDFSRYK